MHAEFVVEPNGQQIFDRLPQLFGDLDPDALAKSRIMKHLKDKTNPRYYACEERPTYRLSAWWAVSGTLRVIIEPTGALDMRRTCQEIWNELRTSAEDLEPQLVSLTLEDDVATRPLAEAGTGVLPSTRRVELVWALAAGAASVLWLIAASFIFGPSGDLILGAVPSIVIGLAAGAYALLDSRSGSLYWR
jgi:hypothetical protein